jgi:hypothetical protein
MLRLLIVTVVFILSTIPVASAIETLTSVTYTSAKKFVCAYPTSIIEVFADNEGKPVERRSAFVEGGEKLDTYMLVGTDGILSNIVVDDQTDGSFVGNSPNIPNLTNATVFLKPGVGADNKPLIQLRIWDVSFDAARLLQSSECRRFSDDALPDDLVARRADRANSVTSAKK